MSFFKRALKLSLFLAPVGYLGYNYKHLYYGNIQVKHSFHLHDLSDYFQDYIKQNNLMIPIYYKTYHAKNPFEHFLEKSILHDLNGLNEYNILVDKDYHEVITNKVELTPEEKLEKHQKGKVHCVFVANSKLQGHMGIVHGGFLTTLIDNTMGIMGFIASDFTPIVTAYLNTNYKKPVTIGKEYILTIEVDKIERKKIFMKATIVDKENQVCTTAEALFIKTNLNGMIYNRIVDIVVKDDKKIRGIEQSPQPLAQAPQKIEPAQ